MVESVAYSSLKTGDTIREHDTNFRVVETNSWMVRDVRVWSVTTVAITKPHRVLSPFVREIGDEWVLQASGFAAFTNLVRPSFVSVRTVVEESAGGDGGVYRRITRRLINGRSYRFVYRIGFNYFATMTVGDEELGTQVHKWELGRVAEENLPGLVGFSRDLANRFGMRF